MLFEKQVIILEMNQKYLKKVALALRNNSKLLREEVNVIRNSNNQKIPGYLET